MSRITYKDDLYVWDGQGVKREFHEVGELIERYGSCIVVKRQYQDTSKVVSVTFQGEPLSPALKKKITRALTK